MLQESHESQCLLNPANDDVEVELTLGSASTSIAPLPRVTM
jgi:hypothetical protein